MKSDEDEEIGLVVDVDMEPRLLVLVVCEQQLHLLRLATAIVLDH